MLAVVVILGLLAIIASLIGLLIWFWPLGLLLTVVFVWFIATVVIEGERGSLSELDPDRWER